MTAMQATAAEHARREAVMTESATTERNLWSLASRLNSQLADKLLRGGASASQALTAIEALLATAPKPQQQQENRTGPSEEFASGIPAFGAGYLGDEFSREMARGEAVAKHILSKVALTK